MAVLSFAANVPVVLMTRLGPFALAHNGHLVNAAELRAQPTLLEVVIHPVRYVRNRPWRVQNTLVSVARLLRVHAQPVLVVHRRVADQVDDAAPVSCEVRGEMRQVVDGVAVIFAVK